VRHTNVVHPLFSAPQAAPKSLLSMSSSLTACQELNIEAALLQREIEL
jgi:hypothetical protein